MAVPREEGKLESGGCPIHYFRWGDPSKPGLLMMHGFLAHSRCFAFIAPFLAQDYHVVAYDFSGMGDSGSREAYPDDVRLQELMDVARHTGMFDNDFKPTLISHSYGGNIGLVAMESFHERFAGLIICDLMTLRPERLKAHLGDSEQPNSPPDLKRTNRVYPDYTMAKGRYVLSPPQRVAEDCLFDYMAYHSLKEVDGGWSWKFSPSVFFSDMDLRAKLYQQGHRTAEAPGRIAIVYGQQSDLFDDDSADYVRECGGGHIPMIGIPNAKHHLMLDEPIAFVTALRSVLALWS